MGNQHELEVPPDTTPARLRELVDELQNSNVQLRHSGRALSAEEEQSTTLQNGDTVVGTPPAVKHGDLA